MELASATRSNMVTAIKDLIEGGASPVGKFEFYDSSDVLIVALQLANPCMTVVAGVGTFNDTTPYLRGTVGSGAGGTANRFSFLDDDDVVIFTGTCGDPSNTGKDIQFNTLIWADFDVITVTGLTFSQPIGTNSYIV